MLIDGLEASEIGAIDPDEICECLVEQIARQLRGAEGLEEQLDSRLTLFS